MIKRVVEISSGSYLYLKNSQLMIDKNGKNIGQVPIEDIGVLILDNTATTLTQRLMVACQECNTVVIICDDKHLPCSFILPVVGKHSLHAKILKEQIAISEPTRKRLWQKVVKDKIIQQAKTLSLCGKECAQLTILADKVKPGDAGNREAVAAQKYWRILFGNGFKRNDELNALNSLLNYGYSIIKAMVARSVCGAGLHPALGLFHSNQYNAMSLADDIMEPFRPWVDQIAYDIANHGELDVNREKKSRFLRLLDETVIYQNKRMPFMVSMHYLTANLKRCYTRKQKEFLFPQLETRY